MDTKKTGAYLAALRKARGMTQQEAADQLGVSNKTVSKWENVPYALQRIRHIMSCKQL